LDKKEEHQFGTLRRKKFGGKRNPRILKGSRNADNDAGKGYRKIIKNLRKTEGTPPILLSSKRASVT